MIQDISEGAGGSYATIIKEIQVHSVAEPGIELSRVEQLSSKNFRQKRKCIRYKKGKQIQFHI